LNILDNNIDEYVLEGYDIKDKNGNSLGHVDEGLSVPYGKYSLVDSNKSKV